MTLLGALTGAGTAQAPNNNYWYRPNGTGGLNYYNNDVPVTNQQYGNGTGQNYKDLEAAVAQSYAQQNAQQQSVAAKIIGDGGSSGSSTAGSAADLAFLAGQANDLRLLLGRLGTAEAQGLQRSEDSYNEGVGGATKDRDTQVQGQNEAKVGAYGTIDRNANRGYRSLAQIIGRASGTGSSAFQELLPDVVGKDTSAKRFDATKNYDTNLSKISTSFEDVLADLMKQKKQNEESLRTGIEGKRQELNSQLATNAAQEAQARGGGYEAARVAQAPYNAAIENSRNAVEGFFNQYRTPYTPKAIQATVNPYNTDRAAINAGQQGGDASNPYASLLRKRLQEQR